MEIPIIYEDDFLLVIDKPAKVIVNCSQKAQGKTIEDWARERLKISPKREEGANLSFFQRAGVVHRLDKETSGLLLIAKEPKTFFLLQRQFSQRKVVKKYFALVHGEIKEKEGTVKAPVGRLPWKRFRFGVLPTGREAMTSFRTLAIYSRGEKRYSFLEVSPQSGRTHQIRVHFKFLGFPLVGDSLYAGRKTFREDKEISSRLFLQAFYLKFFHPFLGKEKEFSLPLDFELEKILRNFQIIKKTFSS